MAHFAFLWHSCLLKWYSGRKKTQKQTKKEIQGVPEVRSASFSVQFKFWVDDYWNVWPGRHAWSAVMLLHARHCKSLHGELALNRMCCFHLFRTCARWIRPCLQLAVNTCFLELDCGQQWNSKCSWKGKKTNKHILIMPYVNCIVYMICRYKHYIFLFVTKVPILWLKVSLGFYDTFYNKYSCNVHTLLYKQESKMRWANQEKKMIYVLC